jgi:hypothetical protein
MFPDGERFGKAEREADGGLMGSSGPYYSKERLEEIERQRVERLNKEDARRKRFAQKIVTVVVDKVVNEIIRPGPKPEERECYDVAHEIRELSPELVNLVTDVIKVTDTEGR